MPGRIHHITNCITRERRQSGPIVIARLTRSFSLALVVALLFFLLPVCSEGQTLQKKPVSIDKKVSDLEKEVARLATETDVYTTDYLPEPLQLCDKRVHLSRDDSRERFEREFFQLLENKGLLTIIVKRYLKYYSMISGEIQRAGMPADLIYLVITESYLNPRALSRANAAGLWQFIKETGKREGLYVGEHVDDRYNIKKATRSALAHLRKLNGEFGDWLLAMAAYNCGAGRIREAISNQETNDFFQMFLPEETERYIFRILAIKEIIIERERLGVYTDERTLYKPVQVAEVTIELDQETHLATLSKSMDVPFRTFRILNLHLRKYRLPKGTYTLNVPYDKKDGFLRKLRNYPSITVVSEG